MTNEMTPAPFTTRVKYPESDLQNQVLKFHRAFGAPAADMPTTIGVLRGKLRVEMVREELNEFDLAVSEDDIVEQYDALLDILVLAFGGLVEMGIDAHPGFSEVMRANMSKLGANGQPIISRGEELDGFPAGKILKGPRYTKPDLFLMLLTQGWTPTHEEYQKFYYPEDLIIQAGLQKGVDQFVHEQDGVEWDLDLNQPMSVTREQSRQFESKQEIIDHLEKNAPGIADPAKAKVLNRPANPKGKQQ